MANRTALLFLPDISGFTQFVRSTEIEHSQHVIAELLELLIESNQLDLKLAEIEGDALFFYREELPTAAEFFDQVKAMFKAFYEHLALLKTHRICPCNACLTAPDLELKIIAHAGPVEFIRVRDSVKPFGPQVIEAHRLMKNSIDSDSYLLISEPLAKALSLPQQQPEFLDFATASETYDGGQVDYHYAIVNSSELDLEPPNPIKVISFDRDPDFKFEQQFPVSRDSLYEYVANYSKRHLWNKGVDAFKFSENEVTRVGSAHTCVINHRNIDFEAITKQAGVGQLIYGEMSHNPPPFLDSVYQFMTFEAKDPSSSRLTHETYLLAKSPIKKALLTLFGRKLFRKATESSLELLGTLIEEENAKQGP